MYLSSCPYIKVDGQIYHVNADPEKGYSICPKQMKAVIRQINYMCDNYRRVFWFVFDLHMPQGKYTGNNEVISQFLKTLSSKVKQQYGVSEIGYSWCRELEKAKQQHYHVMIMLDGKQIRHPDTLFNLLKGYWSKASVGGAAWMPKNCYGIILKQNFEDKSNLVYRVSYQAKGRGKGYKDAQSQNYGTSRLSVKKVRQHSQLEDKIYNLQSN